MNADIVDKIVNAVLYEGYMLYPYRPSAIKNRQRFNFGVVYPRAYSETLGGTEPCVMQTECLVRGNGNARCSVRVRFLRMVARSIGKRLDVSSISDSPAARDFEKVDALEIDGRVFRPWQEAAEEEIDLPEVDLAGLASQPLEWPFRLSAKQEIETLHDERAAIAGALIRDRATIAGTVELASQRINEHLFKLTARISNDSRLPANRVLDRESALMCSLVSTHTILGTQGAEFVSLVDPPEELNDFAASCKNVGTWPVLVGESGQLDTMLSSPIILYDYPEIAAESPGDLFDGAEIDEILSLRILAMTDDEKREMRESDDRAREILERTETLPDEHFAKLHGVLRGLRAVGKSSP